MKVTPVKKPFGMYKPGDEFELPDRLARTLVAIGKLSRVDPATVAATVEPEMSERTGKPKRQYRRRDMEAE
jgi:hypothetical protein